MAGDITGGGWDYSNTAGQLTEFDPGAISTDYMLNRSEKTLYRNLELVQHGDKAFMPEGTGDTIYIPHYGDASDTPAPVIAPGTVSATLNQVQPDKRSTQVQAYGKPYGYDRHTEKFANLFDYHMELSERSSYAAALAMEDATQDAILGTSTTPGIGGQPVTDHIWVMPSSGEVATGAGAPWGTVTSTTQMSLKAIAQARRQLRNNSVPGFSKFNGRYIGMLGPGAVYDLQTDISSNVSTFEESSMGMDSVFRDNVIGVLFGFQMIESNFSAKQITATGSTEIGITSGQTADVNMFFGAQAFYCVPLERMEFEIVDQPPGSGGATGDPYAMQGSITAIVWYGAIQGNGAKRMVLSPSGSATF